MRSEFIDAARSNAPLFEAELSGDVIERLADYFELVQKHNELLHLVAPSPPAEFATRHVLESLTLLPHLPADAHFADVGTGAGLPAIPCLIARIDLKATLIESKAKKTQFLEEAVGLLGLAGRCTIVNRQFDEAEQDDFTHVACRALDKFTEKLPRLLRWSRGRTLLLFGGENLEAALRKRSIDPTRRLMPLSERRYLFVCKQD